MRERQFLNEMAQNRPPSYCRQTFFSNDAKRVLSLTIVCGQHTAADALATH
jgi:hypothetical protein